MSIRLNKLLAHRGIAARRKCDELIRAGLVRVNGAVVTEPGTQVEPGKDKILVRGRPLPAGATLRYFVLNKPVGVITTMHDPEGRRTIAHFLPPGGRTYPVGRLDADTSGLLILTNDGELAHRLMHPRYGVEKQYKVRLARPAGEGQLARLRDGVEFEPGIVSAPARVHVFESGADGAVIGIALHEGRYRQVRRMCEAVGLPVVTLHRAAYGPLRLGPLEKGTWRELSAAEVAALKEASARPRGPRLSRFDLAQRRRAKPAAGGPRRAPRPPVRREVSTYDGPMGRRRASTSRGRPTSDRRTRGTSETPRPRRDGAPPRSREFTPRPRRDGAPPRSREFTPRPRRDGAPPRSREFTPRPRRDGAPRPSRERAFRGQRDTTPARGRERAPRGGRDGAPPRSRERVSRGRPGRPNRRSR